MRCRSLALGLGLPLGLACGAAGVTFDGTARSRWLEPRDVAIADVPPQGHERLGKVAAQCAPLDTEGALRDARFSDLACSPGLLVAALRDRAAEVGGSVLVALRCDRDDISCEAGVWAPRPGVPRAAVSERPLNEDPQAAVVPGGPPRGHTADAWRVVVSSWSVSAARAPSDPSRIEELAIPRVGLIHVGDLEASCAAGCARESLRAALRAAASRLGATSVAGVRCIQQDARASCIASALAPELDPDVDPGTEKQDPRLSEAR